jgi:hypothetical protein
MVKMLTSQTTVVVAKDSANATSTLDRFPGLKNLRRLG